MKTGEHFGRFWIFFVLTLSYNAAQTSCRSKAAACAAQAAMSGVATEKPNGSLPCASHSIRISLCGS